MSRSIAQDIIDKLESNEITTFYLFQYTVGSTTYRYTDCEIPITTAIDGTTEVTFDTRSFSFDDVSYSAGDIVDSVSIRIDNLDSVLTAIFAGSVIVDAPALLYMILFEDDNSILATQLLFNGTLNDFELSETELSITVSSPFTKWHQTSNAKHSKLCRWKKFKGTECKYAGAELLCNRLHSRCVELSNEDNFGGFRWLPEIEDLKIWWGPTPEQM